MSDTIVIPKRKPRAVCAARGVVVHYDDLLLLNNK